MSVPAIALVVVHGGVAETYTPLHVLCPVIDLDNYQEYDDEPLATLPKGLGFEQLVAEAGLEEGTDFEWEA